MPGLTLAILQLAAAQPSPPPPDIELNARIRAREVTVRQDGQASLQLRVAPGVAPPVEVERSAPAGAARYRNLTISVRAAARIDPQASPSVTQQGTNDEDTPP